MESSNDKSEELKSKKRKELSCQNEDVIQSKRQKTDDDVDLNVSQSSEVIEQLLIDVENMEKEEQSKSVPDPSTGRESPKPNEEESIEAAAPSDHVPLKLVDEKNIPEQTDKIVEEKMKKSKPNLEETLEVGDSDEVGKFAVRRRTHLKHVKDLRSELRMEEAKLILMKKLRQSQMQRMNQSAPKVTRDPKTNINMTQKSSMSKQQIQNEMLQQALKSQRGSSQQSQNAFNALMQLPGFFNPGGMMNLQQNMFRSKQFQNPSSSSSNLDRNKVNVDLAMQQFIAQQKLLAEQQKLYNRPKKEPVYATAQQKQAAAKLALRKQLEKTLLEIPPPQPPPPEITFLPSAASTEFICLLGLEHAVNKIQMLQDKTYRKESRGRAEVVAKPVSCVQCASDFSPLWKKIENSTDVICHQCVTTNQKKALKAEHTNRLKTAFVKALQQEQEIEQRMQDEETKRQDEKPSIRPSPAAAPQQPDHKKMLSNLMQLNAGVLKANERQMLLEMLPEGIKHKMK